MQLNAMVIGGHQLKATQLMHTPVICIMVIPTLTKSAVIRGQEPQFVV